MSGPLPVLRRLLRRPVAVASAAWLLLVMIAAAFPRLVTARDPYQQDLAHALEGPSSSYPLGTDILGRDLLSRVVHGAPDTLWGMGIAALVAVACGVSLGLLSGFVGGLVDSAVTRAADVLFALPAIVILLVVVTVFPNNITAAMATFGVLIAPGLARIVRGATIATKEELYVAAAQVLGLRRRQILWRHLLPRLGSLVIVQASLIAALGLVLQSGLGFLGFGPPPPRPSWGGLVGDALTVIGRQPWALVPPGFAIGLTAMAFALFGDAIRDATTESWATTKLTRPRRLRSLPPLRPAPYAAGTLLAVCHLSVTIPTRSGPTLVVEDVSFNLAAGETLGIVGESGCGKTVTALSILGLVPGNGTITSGECLLEGRDLVRMSAGELSEVRGRRIGYVSQEPSVSLDPTFRVGEQVREAVQRHTGLSTRGARARVLELLEQVQLPDPERVARRYPHQVSGGMAQRISIAFALAGNPSILIADEPTTALDVTVQAEILALLRSLSTERDMAVLLVTHDWGVVADLCDRAVVMYAGQVVETCSVSRVFKRPLHPYTIGLLRSNPVLATERGRLPTIPGRVPRPGEWPDGCRFAPRCAYATADCRAAPVALDELAPGHLARCIRAAEISPTEVAL
jgi:peptide/nickel transport system permease protein